MAGVTLIFNGYKLMFKKSVCVLFCVFSMTLSTCVFAGGGHSHGAVVPPTDEQVVDRAYSDLEAIVDLSVPIEGELLDESWKMVTNRKIVKKTDENYILEFNHPEEKRALYMIMDSNGFLLDANFTGEF